MQALTPSNENQTPRRSGAAARLSVRVIRAKIDTLAAELGDLEGEAQEAAADQLERETRALAHTRAADLADVLRKLDVLSTRLRGELRDWHLGELRAELTDFLLAEGARDDLRRWCDR